MKKFLSLVLLASFSLASAEGFDLVGQVEAGAKSRVVRLVLIEGAHKVRQNHKSGKSFEAQDLFEVAVYAGATGVADKVVTDVAAKVDERVSAVPGLREAANIIRYVLGGENNAVREFVVNSLVHTLADKASEVEGVKDLGRRIKRAFRKDKAVNAGASSSSSSDAGSDTKK